MAADDLILTLSDDDVSDEEFSDTESAQNRSTLPPLPSTNGTKRKRTAKEHVGSVKKSRTDGAEGEAELDSDFEFENEQGLGNVDELDTWALNGDSRGNAKAVDLDAIIARRKPVLKGVVKGGEDEDSDEAEVESGEDEESDELEAEDDDAFDGVDDEEDEVSNDVDDDEDNAEENEDDDEEEAAPVPHPDDIASDNEQDEDDEQDAIEEQKRNAFFAADERDTRLASTKSAFHTMNLSRPILRGLTAIGFSKPTPIQAKTIPVALEGKDLVGGAVTGSGKTAAFLIPILERLLFRPRRTATTRVAILMPTRELALQCFNVATKLASFTDITFGQAIGGLNSREQEKQLKLRPDVVIATPGRFIDLERNTTALAVNTVEILVLDEADRMLEEGFADELNEILDKIPKSRQTMLFSATMTSKVDDLIRVGLQRPVRLMVDSQKQTVSGLVQEFVRLRPGKEDKRLAYLLYLCTSVFTDRAIIFFRQKVEAHRVRVIFGLCGIKAAELHGSMSQEQRIHAIEAFRTNTASFLLATDLASRGLDIKGIEVVINYEAPQTHEIYLHRVGRTARAGRTGKSCTLAAEPDRKVVKAAVKMGKAQGAQIRQRTVDPADIDVWHTRLQGLEDDIEAVLREEKEERVMQQVDRDLTRADNLVTHEAEIKARPKKTWFESEREKKIARDKGSAMLNGAREDGEVKKKSKEKLSNKKKKRMADTDERKSGPMWKKGKAERMGGGALKPPGKGKGKSKGKPAKPKSGNA